VQHIKEIQPLLTSFNDKEELQVKITKLSSDLEVKRKALKELEETIAFKKNGLKERRKVIEHLESQRFTKAKDKAIDRALEVHFDTLIQTRRKHVSAKLLEIFQITENEIMGIPEAMQGENDANFLGFIVQILNMISNLYGFTLRYPMFYLGSRSFIQDSILNQDFTE
jgi:predicted  nucleic acid-binding Zn-ribbon protein